MLLRIHSETGKRQPLILQKIKMRIKALFKIILKPLDKKTLNFFVEKNSKKSYSPLSVRTASNLSRTSLTTSFCSSISTFTDS